MWPWQGRRFPTLDLLLLLSQLMIYYKILHTIVPLIVVWGYLGYIGIVEN